MTFTSNKVFNLGSAAFRQWRATHSHCQYIHGYNLTANITFEADHLDERNWCADFGGLKDLKVMLQHTFDHKLVIAGDDPQLELFKTLDTVGVAQVVILQGGVGCERFAEYVLKTADNFIDEATDSRVRVKSVQINEHDSNFATCYRQIEMDPIAELTPYAASFTQTDASQSVVLEDVHSSVSTTLTQPEDEPYTSEVSHAVDETEPLADTPVPIPAPSTAPPNPIGAPVGKANGTKTKGGWFDGTTWG
jgi:6-pyruvoyltetrahydropterin/6-carboxytetrahydropterin synthase